MATHVSHGTEQLPSPQAATMADLDRQLRVLPDHRLSLVTEQRHDVVIRFLRSAGALDG